MPKKTRRRVNIEEILADPELRRELMIDTIIATQAREGITVTRERAAEVYDEYQEDKRKRESKRRCK